MLLFKWNGETLTFRQITHFQAQSIVLTCNYCANVLNHISYHCPPYCSTTLATTDHLVPIPPILRASTTVVCYKGISFTSHSPCRHGNTPVADGSCAGDPDYAFLPFKLL